MHLLGVTRSTNVFVWPLNCRFQLLFLFITIFTAGNTELLTLHKLRIFMHVQTFINISSEELPYKLFANVCDHLENGDVKFVFLTLAVFVSFYFHIYNK